MMTLWLHVRFFLWLLLSHFACTLILLLLLVPLLLSCLCANVCTYDLISQAGQIVSSYPAVSLPARRGVSGPGRIRPYEAWACRPLCLCCRRRLAPSQRPLPQGAPASRSFPAAGRRTRRLVGCQRPCLALAPPRSPRALAPPRSPRSGCGQALRRPLPQSPCHPWEGAQVI